MSLTRRIWLTILGLTLAAFLGSLLVNIHGARAYLEEQLTMKNLDNANALALSMSQIPDKDPVTIELLLSAQFDTGHYQEIRLLDPKGGVLVERKQEAGMEAGAPAWFVGLFPIRAAPGIAQVQDGWKQYGSIHLASHAQFAHRDLWRTSLRLSGWFLIGGLLAGLLGSLALRAVTRPLDKVVEQARAISERRFIRIEPPRVPELDSVVSAMNDMVARVRQMFADEAARLDTLRDRLNHDPVTGLANREHFMGRLHDALESEDAPPQGVLLILRLVDLAAINREFGHAGADRLLGEIAGVLETARQGHERWHPARLGGPDFALLAENETAPETIASPLVERILNLRDEHWTPIEDLFHIGAIRYRRGDAIAAVLTGADRALALAEQTAPNTWMASEQDASAVEVIPAETWREIFADAISRGRLKLAHFPVIDNHGGAMHRESFIRLRTRGDGPWRPAGDFMPIAVRLNFAASLDLDVIRMALEELRQHDGAIAINLTAETIADWEFRARLADLLKTHAELCPRLWLEVPEYGVFGHIEAFRDLSREVKRLGSKIGIERFGHRLAEIDLLADLGVDYVKVDTSFIRDIDRQPGNQEFLRGLCRMARNLGILVIAVGVRDERELALLPELGFDGATGPAVGDIAS